MNHNSLYAVIDLETTGTNPKEDRIIQIGIVFIQNGQIIETYAQDINPRMKITKQIEALTHISNEQLANAPFFEDVAGQLYEKITQSVFVAHNIYFDYQFLSKEFERVGYPALSLPGVDTVELAQIFLPTLASYRLSDISDFLNIEHNRPHQADSDAAVTAELMLAIEQIIHSLPLVTLEKITELSTVLGKETGEYLKAQLAYLQKNIPPLTANIEIIKGLAIQKKEALADLYPQKKRVHFPLTLSKKKRAYGQILDVRTGQADMMDAVYQFFFEGAGHKDFAIEAPTGSGKSFGYLFPLSYLATIHNPVIISTTSILLEQQLLNEAIPLVNKINKQSLVGTMIKSSRYFIDLNKFSETLKHPLKQKQYALHQMACLVWLLSTKTGDLTELNLANLEHTFFKHVRHMGEKFVAVESDYYAVDFWRYLKQKIKHSNVLIVNHAFLIKENFREIPWLPKSDYLVIDEAHHLPEIAEKMGYQSFSFGQLKQLLYKIDTHQENYPNWSMITKQKDWPVSQITVQRIISETQLILENIESDIVETTLLDAKFQVNEEILLTQQMLENLPIYVVQDIHKLMKILNELVLVLMTCQNYLTENWAKWLPSERLMMQVWFDYLEELQEDVSFIELFLQNDDYLVKWLKITDKHYHIHLHLSRLNASVVSHATWYERYTKILYTGGTLASGSDEQYLAKNLGIGYMPFAYFGTKFDYEKQAKFYLPVESLHYTNLASPYFAEYIGNILLDLAKHLRVNMLVLFTSHDMLQTVYQQIQPEMLEHNVEVLGQGISGSRERIIKRFTQQTGQKILLGADSFWEGVDLPGDALKLIVIARLPFESPERPFVKEKLRYLQATGVDGFNQYSLPKAIIRLRQGIGRLIRTNQDKGVILMLDPRMLTAKYAKKLHTALPDNLTITHLHFQEMLPDIKDFLGSPVLVDEDDEYVKKNKNNS